MAVDHALAESVDRGSSPAVLRFYAWDPAAVSIGYNEAVRDRRERLEALRARGFDAVRRPTGGRAVLHADEVTYSVIAPADREPLSGGLRASCARIHAAILTGLEALGIADLSLYATAAASRRRFSIGPRNRLPCFASASQSEIVWCGQKLVGSAQARLGGVLVQHGSILLGGSQSELEPLGRGEMARWRTTNLAEAGGRSFAFAEVAGAVREGFQGELGLTFMPGGLEASEEARARELVEARYGREEFLYRR